VEPVKFMTLMMRLLAAAEFHRQSCRNQFGSELVALRFSSAAHAAVEDQAADWEQE
jgi:hypothetical protein